MALSKRALKRKNVFKGFSLIQLFRERHICTHGYWEASQHDQAMLSSKHRMDGGVSHAIYSTLCKEAHAKYNGLIKQWENGKRSKYAMTRY